MLDDEEKAELREEFDYFDDDDNGQIDRTEFAHLLDALDADMSDAEMDIGFEFIDTDGNGAIDFDEFVDWWTEQ